MKKSIIKKLILNTFGFGIYIFSQQILLLPTLSNSLSDSSFASIVLYMSIFNLVTNSIGGELGNVRIINKLKGETQNYAVIFKNMCFIILIISFFSYFYLEVSVYNTVIIFVTLILSSSRLYTLSLFRANDNYKKVIAQNILYFFGSIVGLVLFYKFNNPYTCFLIPEILVATLTLKNNEIFKINISKTSLYKDIKTAFYNLMYISIIFNALVYFDKILIYPILGEYSVNVYFAASAMSKVVSLVTNPMSSVILSWISSVDKKEYNLMLIKTLKVLLPFIIVVFVVNVPITRIASSLLYNQYFNDIENLIIPISIATALSTAAFLTKSILMKIVNIKIITTLYTIHFILFIIISYYMSINYGLIGFCYGSIIAKLELMLSFVVLIIYCVIKKEGVEKGC